MKTVKTSKKQKAGFQPGQSGNPKGRPKGARNKTTVAVERLLDGEAEAITRLCIEKAKEGDLTAIRLCMDRICPPRKDKPAWFELPPISDVHGVAKAMQAVLSEVSKGTITPLEGTTVAGLIETYRKMLEITDLENRISALEDA